MDKKKGEIIQKKGNYLTKTERYAVILEIFRKQKR